MSNDWCIFDLLPALGGLLWWKNRKPAPLSDNSIETPNVTQPPPVVRNPTGGNDIYTGYFHATPPRWTDSIYDYY